MEQFRHCRLKIKQVKHVWQHSSRQGIKKLNFDEKFVYLILISYLFQQSSVSTESRLRYKRGNLLFKCLAIGVEFVFFVSPNKNICSKTIFNIKFICFIDLGSI